MTINLSEEMIYKISCLAFGRKQELKQKRELVKNSIEVGKHNIRRKHMQLQAIEKSLAEAEEIHELFVELYEQITEGR